MGMLGVGGEAIRVSKLLEVDGQGSHGLAAVPPGRTTEEPPQADHWPASLPPPHSTLLNQNLVYARRQVNRRTLQMDCPPIPRGRSFSNLPFPVRPRANKTLDPPSTGSS